MNGSFGSLLYSLVVLLVAGCALASPLAAQTSIDAPQKSAPAAPDSERANPPLHMQADQLIFDTKTSRVIVQGAVEMYFNTSIVTADQVIYDQLANELVANGNAQLKNPDGSILRGDHLRLADEIRDAFRQSLNQTLPAKHEPNQ